MDEVVETAAVPVESSVTETEAAPVALAEQPLAAEPIAVPFTDETALAGKTVASVETYSRASVTVIDILGTNGVHYFVKVAHNQAEVGGTEAWGTGVLQA